MFSSANPSCEHSYALFDIGASSIGAALAVRTKGGIRVIWSTRIEYAYNDAPDYERYQRAMYSALLEAGMALTSEGGRVARDEPSFSMHTLTAYAVLGPPWFLASVRTGMRRKEKPFEVTHGLQDELRSSLFTEFQNDPRSASWFEVSGIPELLEQFDTTVRMDGYRVDVYEKRRTRELVQESYLALVAQPVAEQVRTILRRILPNHDTRMTTSTRLLSSLFCRAAPTALRRAVLVELGGPISAVTLMTDRSIQGTITVPSGIHALLEATTPKAVSAAEARSKVLPILKQLRTQADTQVPDAIEHARSIWFEEITRGIRDLSCGITPPREVVLFAPDVWYPLYAPVLERAWDAPGIRHAYTLRVLQLAAPEGGEAPHGEQDARIYSIARAVDECVARVA